TNAYTSALSATGSLLISGASRCDDICPSLVVAWRDRQQPCDERWIAIGRLLRAREHRQLAALRVVDVCHHGLRRQPRGRRIDDRTPPARGGRERRADHCRRHAQHGRPRGHASRSLDERPATESLLASVFLSCTHARAPLPATTLPCPSAAG